MSKLHTLTIFQGTIKGHKFSQRKNPDYKRKTTKDIEIVSNKKDDDHQRVGSLVR